jgi:flagellar hook-associated protein 3 FlgL
MRVSTSHQYDVSQKRIMDTGLALYKAQRAVSSGKRIHELSDDTYGAVLATRYKSLKSGLEQYSENLDRAAHWLSNSENSFAEIGKILNRANALAVSGGTATTSQSERDAMAAEIDKMMSQVIQLANTKTASGEYIFAGTNMTTEAFTLDSSGLTYNGNTIAMRVESNPGVTVEISHAEPNSFTDLYNRLDYLRKSLLSGNESQIAGQGLKDIQASQAEFNRIRAEFGTKARSVESLQSDQARRIEELTKDVSDIEDIDLTKAITDYKGAEMAYQASLQAASQGYRLSLMDFIRG